MLAYSIISLLILEIGIKSSTILKGTLWLSFFLLCCASTLYMPKQNRLKIEVQRGKFSGNVVFVILNVFCTKRREEW